MRFPDKDAKENSRLERGKFKWFAWYPVNSSITREIIWLETVYKHRSINRWYYEPMD